MDPVSETLKYKKCRKDLSVLHNRFIIAPIDKATGNVSFICKRFYAEVIVNELRLRGVKSKTYQSIRKKRETIIKTNMKDLKNNF